MIQRQIYQFVQINKLQPKKALSAYVVEWSAERRKEQGFC